MLVEQLYIAGFRNIEAANVVTDKQVNIFFGKNGSGKTSILESLFYLGRAKSFRTNKKQEIIRTDSNELIVSAKICQKDQHHQLGIGLDKKGTTKLKLNGDDLQRLSEASSLVPSQLITPESFDVFWSSPKSRRSFIDFGLFHVEHEYKNKWQDYIKLLKHNNALLRNPNSSYREIEYWYRSYLTLANEIDSLREAFLLKHFSEAISILVEEIKDSQKAELIEGIEVRYKKKMIESDVSDSRLKELIEKERRYKQVTVGPNRSDIIFIKNSEDISSKLSRGQAKMLFYLLEVAMVNIIRNVTQKNIAILVDDLPSEVDPDTRSTMIEMLLNTKAQIFVTGIESKIAMEFNKYTDSIKVFHVEHGKVSATDMEQLCP